MEEEVKRPYKIMLGDTIIVHRKDVREFTFYHTSVKNKKADGTEEYLEKKLQFPKDTDITDNTTIRINDMFEIGRKSGYETIWSLYIKDFEVVPPTENAYDEYKQSKYDFDINELDGSTGGDTGLPF